MPMPKAKIYPTNSTAILGRVFDSGVSDGDYLSINISNEIRGVGKINKVNGKYYVSVLVYLTKSEHQTTTTALYNSIKYNIYSVNQEKDIYSQDKTFRMRPTEGGVLRTIFGIPEKVAENREERITNRNTFFSNLVGTEVTLAPYDTKVNRKAKRNQLKRAVWLSNKLKRNTVLLSDSLAELEGTSVESEVNLIKEVKESVKEIMDSLNTTPANESEEQKTERKQKKRQFRTEVVKTLKEKGTTTLTKEELGLNELPGSGIDVFELVTPGVTPDTTKASFAVLNNFDSIGPYTFYPNTPDPNFHIRRVDDDNGDEKYYLVTESEDLRVHLHKNGNWDSAIESNIDRRVFDPEEQIKVTTSSSSEVVSIKIVIGSVAAEAAFVLKIKSLLSESRRAEERFSEEWMERCLRQGKRTGTGSRGSNFEKKHNSKFVGQGWEAYNWKK